MLVWLLKCVNKLGIKPARTLFIPYYSSNEFIDEVKTKILEDFLTSINEQNEMFINSDSENEDQTQYTRNNWFKAFIEKGNNGTVVKTILNKRSWWSIQDSHDENYESLEFIWTQWTK